LEDLPSAAVGRIAFVSAVENADIYGLPLDSEPAVATAAPERLTDNTAMDIQPALSSDGRLLVFASNRTGNFDIWKRDLQTAEELPVSFSPAFESIPQVTADGSSVAFNRLENQSAELYVASLDGRSAATAARVCHDDCFLPWGWLSGSKQLLYWSRSLTQIGVLDTVSGEKAIVLRHQRYPLLMPDVSPDGRWIAFLADISLDRGQLFVAPFRGISPIPEESWIAATDADPHGGVPHWSADGNSLYFLSRRDGYDCLWRQALDPLTRRPVGAVTSVHHLHGTRRSISNVRASYRTISIAGNRTVFPMNERTGNIWMAEWPR
jgi:Tol biopolymer transport system component